MNFITYYDNVIPKSFCSEIIQKFESNPQQQKETVLEGHRSFTEINITEHPDWEIIQNKLFGAFQAQDDPEFPWSCAQH